MEPQVRICCIVAVEAWFEQYYQACCGPSLCPACYGRVPRSRWTHDAGGKGQAIGRWNCMPAAPLIETGEPAANRTAELVARKFPWNSPLCPWWQAMPIEASCARAQCSYGRPPQGQGVQDDVRGKTSRIRIDLEVALSSSLFRPDLRGGVSWPSKISPSSGSSVCSAASSSLNRRSSSSRTCQASSSLASLRNRSSSSHKRSSSFFSRSSSDFRRRSSSASASRSFFSSTYAQWPLSLSLSVPRLQFQLGLLLSFSFVISQGDWWLPALGAWPSSIWHWSRK